MKRYILPLLLSCATVTMAWAFDPSLYQTTLTNVKGATAQIEDREIPVGSSGIVLHAFDKEHRAIVATAIVKAKSDGKATVVFKKFKRLEQHALPEYKIAPKNGDIVILNYLYNRILPVMPDEKHFRRFLKTHAKFETVHPDLFAADLYLGHDPQPTRKDFQQVCRQNDLGLLYFAVKDRGYYVDCNSFKILDSEPLEQAIDTQKSMHPFYHRLPEIKNRLGGIMGSESIGDYNLYYQTLLGLK